MRGSGSGSGSDGREQGGLRQADGWLATGQDRTTMAIRSQVSGGSHRTRRCLFSFFLFSLSHFSF
jgi:hypothetical protein